MREKRYGADLGDPIEAGRDKKGRGVGRSGSGNDGKNGGNMSRDST